MTFLGLSMEMEKLLLKSKKATPTRKEHHAVLLLRASWIFGGWLSCLLGNVCERIYVNERKSFVSVCVYPFMDASLHSNCTFMQEVMLKTCWVMTWHPSTPLPICRQLFKSLPGVSRVSHTLRWGPNRLPFASDGCTKHFWVYLRHS